MSAFICQCGKAASRLLLIWQTKKYELSNPCGCCLGFCGLNHDGQYFFKGPVPGQAEVGMQSEPNMC